MAKISWVEEDRTSRKEFSGYIVGTTQNLFGRVYAIVNLENEDKFKKIRLDIVRYGNRW